MVCAPLSRTFFARNRVSTSSPHTPLPSHQKAGVPACQASPAIPSVAEPPTHEAIMEIPTCHGPEARLLMKKAELPFPARDSRSASSSPIPINKAA